MVAEKYPASVSSTLADVHRALPGLAMRWHCASAGETFSCRSTTAMSTFRDSLVYMCDHLISFVYCNLLISVSRKSPEGDQPQPATFPSGKPSPPIGKGKGCGGSGSEDRSLY